MLRPVVVVHDASHQRALVRHRQRSALAELLRLHLKHAAHQPQRPFVSVEDNAPG
jgi:hypothetical protein